MLNEFRDDLIKFGGHAQAAGLSLKFDALEKFMGIVNEQLTKLQAENEGLHASITELTARIEALENPVTE